MIYACLATNFVTLGIYEFTFAGPAFPTGQLITAVIISGIWVSFPGHRLLRAHRDDPAGRRRLRLADPHPGQRPRLRHGRHRVVVHLVAVGADRSVHSKWIMERMILQKSNTWGCVDFEGIRRTAERPIMIGEHLRNVARFKIPKYYTFLYFIK